MKGYSFDELVKLAMAAVKRAGDTMTGNLTTPKVLVSGAQGTEVNALTRKDYVDSAIAAGDALQVSKTGDTMTGSLEVRTKVVLRDEGGAARAMFGIGSDSDIFINNVTSEKYLQLKDDGSLRYSGNSIYHQGFKPTAADVGALPVNANAVSATKLLTARTINGTNFDGTANITTTNWGTARTLTIGNAAKSVNGAGNVAWSLNEIGAARSAGEVFSGEAANISTATFVQWLESIGAFNDKSWTARCGWSYAANRTITDTGCGNIHLAGCTIEVISANKSNYTIRVITPTTSAYGGEAWAEFIYVNNGPDYSPGWRRSYTTSNKPTAADVGLGNLINYGWNYGAVADTYAVRDGSGDLNVRLLRANFENESRLDGAIAFRVNNSNDNYTRYCSNPAAVRNWMKSAKTNWDMDWRAYVEHTETPMTEYHIPGRAAVVTYLAGDGNYRISSSNGAGGAVADRLRLDSSGNLFTHGAIYEDGQRVYSPNNKPPLVSHNHSAAQSNADIVAGGWDHVGAYVMAQMYPADGIGTIQPGNRLSGASLRACSVDWDLDDMHSVALPGTWQCQGFARGKSVGEGDWGGHKTLWIRVA